MVALLGRGGGVFVGIGGGGLFVKGRNASTPLLSKLCVLIEKLDLGEFSSELGVSISWSLNKT